MSCVLGRGSLLEQIEGYGLVTRQGQQERGVPVSVEHCPWSTTWVVHPPSENDDTEIEPSSEGSAVCHQTPLAILYALVLVTKNNEITPNTKWEYFLLNFLSMVSPKKKKKIRKCRANYHSLVKAGRTNDSHPLARDTHPLVCCQFNPPLGQIWTGFTQEEEQTF